MKRVLIGIMDQILNLYLLKINFIISSKWEKLWCKYISRMTDFFVMKGHPEDKPGGSGKNGSVVEAGVKKTRAYEAWEHLLLQLSGW